MKVRKENLIESTLLSDEYFAFWCTDSQLVGVCEINTETKKYNAYFKQSKGFLFLFKAEITFEELPSFIVRLPKHAMTSIAAFGATTTSTIRSTKKLLRAADLSRNVEYYVQESCCIDEDMRDFIGERYVQQLASHIDKLSDADRVRLMLPDNPKSNVANKDDHSLLFSMDKGAGYPFAFPCTMHYIKQRRNNILGGIISLSPIDKAHTSLATSFATDASNLSLDESSTSVVGSFK